MSHYYTETAPGCGDVERIADYPSWHAAVEAALQSDRVVAVNGVTGARFQLPQLNDSRLGKGRFGNGLTERQAIEWGLVVRNADGVWPALPQVREIAAEKRKLGRNAYLVISGPHVASLYRFAHDAKREASAVQTWPIGPIVGRDLLDAGIADKYNAPDHS